MADPDAGVVEQILEPSPARSQNVAGEFTPWVFSFTGEDVLELTSWNTAADVRVTIQGRVRIGPGNVKPFTATHAATTDRMPFVTVHTLPVGELLNVIAYCSAGTPGVGQTIVRLVVRRGAGSAFERLGVLIQGPITANVARAWPGSAIVTPTEGEPFLRSITGTKPAAGAIILETVPNNARWEVLAVFTQFTTSGAAGNRKIYLQFNQAVSIAVVFTSIVIGPGVGFAAITFQPGIAAISDAVEALHQASLGFRVILGAGGQIAMGARGLLAGDQFEVPRLLIREWFDL